MQLTEVAAMKVLGSWTNSQLDIFGLADLHRTPTKAAAPFTKKKGKTFICIHARDAQMLFQAGWGSLHSVSSGNKVGKCIPT